MADDRSQLVLVEFISNKKHPFFIHYYNTLLQFNILMRAFKSKIIVLFTKPPDLVVKKQITSRESQKKTPPRLLPFFSICDTAFWPRSGSWSLLLVDFP